MPEVFGRARTWSALFSLGLKLLTSGSAAFAGAELGVTRVQQEQGVWCWAASGEMVMSFLGTNVAQCIQANSYVRRSDCCATNVPRQCVVAGFPEFENYGFEYDRRNNKELTFEEIQSQITLCRPIAFSWHWLDSNGNDNGGHMMVIFGWRVDGGGTRIVLVHDPSRIHEFEGEMLYSEYVRGRDHRPWRQYFNIRKYVAP